MYFSVTVCQDGMKICGFTSPHLAILEADSTAEQISLKIQFVSNVKTVQC